MKNIFISYRREDSRAISCQIAHELARGLGKRVVFIDVDAIPLAHDFRKAILKSIENTRLLLVVIGPGWLDCVEKDGRRRLDSLDDYVRAEIEGAMLRDVPILPLLVNGASMPGPDDLPPSLRELAYKNAMSLREVPDFSADLAKVRQAIRKTIAPSRRWLLTRLLTSAVLLLGGALGGYFVRDLPRAGPLKPLGDWDPDKLTTRSIGLDYKVERGVVSFLNDPEIGDKFPLIHQRFPVPISLNRHHLGESADLFNCLVLSGRNLLSGKEGDYPQVVRDILPCHNFRLQYLKREGASSFEGTSLFGTPSFRPFKGPFQLIPTVEKATIATGTNGEIRVESRSHFGTAADVLSVRTYSIPSNHQTTATLSVEFIAEEDIDLDPDMLGTDAFRFLTLASLYTDRQDYDANVILYQGTEGQPFQLRLDDPSSTPEGARRPNIHLFKEFDEPATRLGSWLELVKEPGDTRYPDTPSIRVEVTNSSNLNLGIRAFLYRPESQPDTRALDAWLEWLDAPKSIKAGTHLKVEFKITATPPRKVAKDQGSLPRKSDPARP